MKQISLFTKALLSLGLFGLVTLLMAGVLIFTSFMQASDPFAASLERIRVLAMLENDVSYSLRDVQLYEAYKIFSLKYQLPEDQDYNAKIAEIDDQIYNLIQTLESQDAFNGSQIYTTDITEELDLFTSMLESHRETFSMVVSAYESGDEAEIESLVLQLQEENDALNTALRDLIILVEQDRQDALRAFPEDANIGVTFTAIGLALTLLLALVGYILLASYTRPLGRLRNAICAIGGNRYRQDLLGSLYKKGGSAGRLARALDELAVGLRQRNAGLEKEIDRLRQELFESRRRRLKINTVEKRIQSQ
jgi:methyl-accepting chemotaxis protein